MKKKLLLVALVLGLIYAIGGIAYYLLNKKETPKEEVPIAEINGYSYQLKASATEIMKTEFNALKKNLEGAKVDEAEYAESVAKLFVIDLYTLTNKLNKYDVGGADYVLPRVLDNFKLNVQDTLYKYLEDNTNNKREQSLPEVKTITVVEVAEAEIEVGETEYNGYKIKLAWDYVKDMGYDTEGEIFLIKEDIYYYVVEKI